MSGAEEALFYVGIVFGIVIGVAVAFITAVLAVWRQK